MGGRLASFWAEASSVDATCFRLSQCEQIGVGGHEVIRKARHRRHRPGLNRAI
jgi:hypothetical protein